nr:Arm DNA-binding domain-containing protein [Sphingobium sp. SCG-1]
MRSSPQRKKQVVLWDSEIRGFGVRVLPSGLKTFIIQYRKAEGIKRRVNIGRFGVITAEQRAILQRSSSAQLLPGKTRRMTLVALGTR